MTDRPTIRVGRRYRFYSTLMGDDTNGTPLRHYTGQLVRVVAQTLKPGHEDWVPGESERLYAVQADDGVQFEAFHGELNGWIKDTKQYVLPDGRWVDR